MEFPITVKKVVFPEKSDTLNQKGFSGKCGDFVSVRPCVEKHRGKTYLGIFLGDMALGQSARFNKENGELTLSKYMYNPAMFVPDLNEVIFGCSSWWSKIKTPEDLKQISDLDINNVWYMKALKALEKS